MEPVQVMVWPHLPSSEADPLLLDRATMRVGRRHTKDHPVSDVSQGPGWWQASDEKWYPPEQHPDRLHVPTHPPWSPSGSSDAPAAGPTRASGSGVPPSFVFDLKRWSQQDRICGVATLVLFIALFLPWFSYNLVFLSISVNGLWHGWTYLVLLLSLAILAYLVLRTGMSEMPVLPVADAQLILFATTLNTFIVLLAFVFKPSGSDWDFGAFLGLVAAIVAWAPFAFTLVRPGGSSQP
jgi:hypothetical protein